MNNRSRKCEYKDCRNKPLKYGECCYEHSPKCEYPNCKKVVRKEGFLCKDHKKICTAKGCKSVISLELSVCKKHRHTCHNCQRWYRGEKCNSYECKLCKTEGCEQKPCAWTYCRKCRCEGGINCNCRSKKDENRKTCKQCYETMYVTWALGQIFSGVPTKRDKFQFKYPVQKIMESANFTCTNLRRSTCKVGGCNVQLPFKMYSDVYVPTCETHRHINFCLHPSCPTIVDQSSKFYPYCTEVCKPWCSLAQCEYYNPDYTHIICRHCTCRSNRCSNISLGSKYCEDCHKSHILYFMFCKKYKLQRDIYKKILKDAGVKRIAKTIKIFL